MIPWGKRYTATLTKSAVKTVTCEKCGKSYQYEVIRKAQGFGDSWLWLDNRGAEERAVRTAERICDKRLSKAVRIVPCPHCNWFQKHMVGIGKRKRLIYTSLSGLLAAFLLMFVPYPTQGANWINNALPLLGLVLFIGLGIFWYFYYDPNREGKGGTSGS